MFLDTQNTQPGKGYAAKQSLPRNSQGPQGATPASCTRESTDPCRLSSRRRQIAACFTAACNPDPHCFKESGLCRAVDVGPRDLIPAAENSAASSPRPLGLSHPAEEDRKSLLIAERDPATQRSCTSARQRRHVASRLGEKLHKACHHELHVETRSTRHAKLAGPP